MSKRPLSLKGVSGTPAVEPLDKEKPPILVLKDGVERDIGAIVALSGTDEVGFYGLIDKEVVRDRLVLNLFRIILPKQQVNGATCEMDEMWQSQLKEQLIAEAGGNTTLYDKLRFWGHVHPGNSTGPSSQDLVQAREFGQFGCDYYVTVICGKDGSMSGQMWDFEHAVKHTDLQWKIDDPPDQDELMTRWKAQFDSLVSPIKYVYKGYEGSYQGPYQGRGGYGYGYGYDDLDDVPVSARKPYPGVRLQDLPSAASQRSGGVSLGSAAWPQTEKEIMDAVDSAWDAGEQGEVR